MNRSSFGLGLVALSTASVVASAQPARKKAPEPAPEVDMSAETEAAPPAEAEPPVPPPVDPQPAREPASSPATKDTHAAAHAVPVQDIPPGPPAFSWVPFGFIRMQYVLMQSDPNVAFVGRNDGFQMQNARFGVRGAYKDRVRYAFSIDGAVEDRALPNTPEGDLQVRLRDAFGDVVLGGKLFVRGGFFQTWTDPQRLIPDVTREFVDRPIESRGIRNTEGWFTPALPPGRSIGAALRVEPMRPGELGFEIAVQNGSDEFASNNDNDLLAVSVATQFRLADDGFIVASGRWNPRTEGELPFRQDETDLQGALGAQINAGTVRFGAAGIVQRTTFPSTGGPVQNAFGAHAQLALKLGDETPTYVGYRFGILDPSSLILSDRVMEHTVAATIAVPSLRMRFQLQLTHVMEQAARALDNSRAQLAAEVAL